MVHKNIKELYGEGGYQVNFKMTQPKSSNPPQPPLPPPQVVYNDRPLANPKVTFTPIARTLQKIASTE